jgi:hypothetical protein
VIERSTRFVVLLEFPEAIATAQTVRSGIEPAFAGLPPGMRRT